eukprot:Awhi_evm1s12967
MCHLRLKIRYKVDELHKKLTTWLCRTYKTSTMVLKSNRRLNKKTVRNMLTWSHYDFDNDCWKNPSYMTTATLLNAMNHTLAELAQMWVR